MFRSIFLYELRYWVKQPSAYIYLGVFFFISTVAMAGVAELFDPHTPQSNNLRLANSPLNIFGILDVFNKLIVFLFPTIMGVSIYRDFKSNMHSILYSYPFVKWDYLGAKFLSSFLVVCIIVSMLGLGIFTGTQIPGVNPHLIAPFRFAAYWQVYVVFIIPNIFLFGALVFAVTTFTRNIYAGFISIVIIFIAQSFLDEALGHIEFEELAALLDPFGNAALAYYGRYWELSEMNENLLPIKGLVIYNRLIWLGITSTILGLVYTKFDFNQNPITFSFRKKKAERAVKNNFASSRRFRLSPVAFNFSFFHNLKSTWTLSKIEFRYILKSWMFISIILTAVIFIGYQQVVQPQQYGFKLLPVTWQMLSIPTFLFAGIINMLTYLYAGMLVHRAKTARANQLVDSTPIPNWSLLLSKFLAIMKMQFVLLTLIMVMGIAAQAYQGYYNFEIPQYLFKLYVLNFLGHIIWAFASIFVQTVLTNPYLGFFVLILGSMGIGILPELGIESSIFQFNETPILDYSDMNGYGAQLRPFLLLKSYWVLFGFFLLIMTSLLWTRGLPFSLKERLVVARSRFKGQTIIASFVLLLGVSSFGAFLYNEEQKAKKEPQSGQDEDTWFTAFQEKFGRYEDSAQPRITAVNINMDIYPNTNTFKATGTYTLVNKSSQNIDTVVIKSGFDEMTEYDFGRNTTLIEEDGFIKFRVIKLEEALAPGDSLTFTFDVQNEPNSLLRTYANVLKNGSFIGADVFPRFGYTANETKPHPSESRALKNSYQSKDSDLIDFEAVVSTTSDQIAVAPGKLQKEWAEGDRRFFHYKMSHKMKYAFSFNSARYQVRSDSVDNVSLEIYYHEGHEENLDRMMNGLKEAMEYNTTNFSDYAFDNVRIIEFPISQGTFATLTGNAVPTSEVRFIADVDDNNQESIDMPFYVSAHELSHHWWGGQLQPANAKGALMLSESLAEYSTLKVLERKHGTEQANHYRKLYLDSYLRARGRDANPEPPLMLTDGQRYLDYQKGSLVFYALGDYLGEESLNDIIESYLEKVRFQGPPYATSLDFVKHLKASTPDSLHYFIEDAFEQVTLHENRITDAAIEELSDGRYRVDISFLTSKFRSDGIGNYNYAGTSGDSLVYFDETTSQDIYSLPLADYIEIGIFGEDGNELYLGKHKVSQIDNKLTLIVDKQPLELGIDPYLKLIDINPDNNRKQL